MKKQIITLSATALILSAAISSVSCQQSSTTTINKNVKLTNDIDSVSYVIGINLGSQFAKDLPEINLTTFMAGVKKAIDKDTADYGVSAQQANDIVRKYVQKKSEKIAKENLEKAEAFLKENKTKEGVITTESGLQYKIIKPGDGKKSPTEKDQVECLYRGTFIDGEQFDGTDLRGNQPATFPVQGVIKGWTEMLQLMTLGEKVECYIHPNLGYGTMDNGVIPANSLLIFEMELVQIIEPKEETPKK